MNTSEFGRLISQYKEALIEQVIGEVHGRKFPISSKSKAEKIRRRIIVEFKKQGVNPHVTIQ